MISAADLVPDFLVGFNADRTVREVTSAADIDWSAHGNWPGTADDGPGPDTREALMPQAAYEPEEPEEVVGGELVEVSGLALTIEGIAEAELQIVALREAANLDGLDDARLRMEAWGRAAELHERYAEMLRPIVRLKVLVEASIGLLELESRAWRQAPDNSPLVLPSGRVSKVMRADWRILGFAEHRGMLTAALDAAPDPSTSGIALALRRSGVAWVDRRVVEKAWRDSGMSLTALCDALGTANRGMDVFSGPKTGAMGYPKAVRIAAALGVSVRNWSPFLPLPSDRSVARRRWAEAKRALEEQERDQAIKRTVRKRGGAMAELYSMAERMQDVMGQAHREATDQEAREALAVAGVHYRKMRDEIVRALGVT